MYKSKEERSGGGKGWEKGTSFERREVGDMEERERGERWRGERREME